MNGFSSVVDYVGAEAWENILKVLANSLKVPICTLDSSGKEAASAGKLPYYAELLKRTAYGREMISRCWKEVVEKLSKKKDKVLVYYSDGGFLHVWVALTINKEFCGALGCVYLLGKKAKDIDINSLSRSSGLEVEELEAALKKVKKVSEEDVKNFGSSLYVVARIVPQLLKQKREESKKAAELSSIYKVTRLVNSTLELKTVAEHVLKFLAESLKVKNCSVVLFESSAKVSYRFEEKSGLEMLEDFASKEVLKTNNAARVENITEDFRLRNVGESFNFASLIAVPMRIRNEIIGVIILYYEKGSLKEEDLEFVSVIADQLSIAVLNAKEYKEARQTAVIDKLSGVYNRNYFSSALDEFIANAYKEKPLSIALADIDDFKHYNDANGHVKGDVLIKEVASVLKESFTKGEVVGRFGGEEFIILLPNTTNEKAFCLMEGLRKKVESRSFFNSGSQPLGKVTVSIGLVTCLDNSIKAEKLVDSADKMLYKSKSSGKNTITSKVVVSKDLPGVDIGEVEKHHSNQE